ncbi:DUF3373 domain-containing protein [bacterium]|nr:DUF3373 domain-containing protein [bacterium]
MTKTLLILSAVLVLLTTATGSQAQTDTDKRIKALEKRLQQLEVRSAKNKIDLGGDLRVEAHTITGEVPDHYDGMMLQNIMVNTMFYHSVNGGGPTALPMNMDGTFNYQAVGEAIGSDYGAYQAFLAAFDFDTTFPAEMQSLLTSMAQAQGLDPMTMTPADWAAVQNGAMQMMMMVPGVFQEGYKTDNDILYTTRLRLDMDAKVAGNVSFAGRLSMYKPWGASTQVGMFNGQANTLAMDANSPGVPGDETLKVERAYFTWRDIADKPMYLSLGRRPSTAGPPLHFRQDELRAGTPMGSIIDFQFDGATFGYDFTDEVIVRACYGLGYESQYGNGTLLQRPADRLKDAAFFGFNIDAWNTPEMQVQTTIARAFDVTDGFNGFVIMPNDPVTGNPMPGPIVTRYNPSANLGDFDLASLLLARRDGPVDWFVTGSWCKSRPEDGVTTPFGGLMADPFETAEERTGSMYYLGARFNFNEDMTKVGLEWNKGSQYWFNFAPAQDDIIAPKTSTRGTVIEAYLTHRVNHKFIVKLGYINYDYDYSGSGWHVGAPKDLDEAQVLGFPTYKKASKLSLGFTARF